MRHRRIVVSSLLVLASNGAGLPGTVYAAADVSWIEISKLVAAGGEVGDRFGSAIALAADTLVIGASGFFDAGDPGAAYVAVRNPATGAWAVTAKLAASDAAADDSFGSSVGIAGQRIVVGASRDDDLGVDAGSAYVFERDPGTGGWLETAKLLAADGAPSERFAEVSAIDGEVIAVGAPQDDDLGSLAGSAYVFERDPGTGTWLEVAKLLAPDGQALDFFGTSIALDGETIVVGSGAGSVYVFTRDVGTGDWTFAQQLGVADGEAKRFGEAVAVAGATIVGGATSTDLASGAAYVFERDPGTGVWSETAELRGSDPYPQDNFGGAVAIDGDTIAAGAQGDDDQGASSGTVYVFARDPATGLWSETARLLASDGGSSLQFGEVVAVEGGTLAIGTDGLSIHPGAAYLFASIPVDPSLSISGTCPGTLLVQGAGLTPLHEADAYYGVAEGMTEIPLSPCAGTLLGIAGARRLPQSLPIDPDGEVTGSPTVGANGCGIYVQLLDRNACAVSNVAQIP